MNRSEVSDFILQHKFVAVMRGAFTPQVALDVVGVLYNEGIRAFELTMNSEQPIEALRALQDAYGKEICVGMGTVLDAGDVPGLIDAGAQFIVSPAFQPDVVQATHQYDTLMIPGVITPSEAVAAWNIGCEILKLFPIGVLGVDYFKSVFGPLDHMQFMCNGGVNAENAHAFLKAGALACGLAGWLTGDGTTSLDIIRNRARQLLQYGQKVL